MRRMWIFLLAGFIALWSFEHYFQDKGLPFISSLGTSNEVTPQKETENLFDELPAENKDTGRTTKITTHLESSALRREITQLRQATRAVFTGLLDRIEDLEFQITAIKSKIDFSIPLSANEPLRLIFPEEILGGIKHPSGNLSISTSGSEMTIIANDKVDELGEPLIVKLRNTTFLFQLRRATPKDAVKKSITIKKR
ncbi:MAG: hypothetical protein PHC51_00800 [bacterium]|nr:hypothetical protein [bacterium]